MKISFILPAILFCSCATYQFPNNNLTEQQIKKVMIGMTLEEFENKITPKPPLEELRKGSDLTLVYPRDYKEGDRFYCENWYFNFNKKMVLVKHGRFSFDTGKTDARGRCKDHFNGEIAIKERNAEIGRQINKSLQEMEDSETSYRLKQEQDLQNRIEKNESHSRELGQKKMEFCYYDDYGNKRGYCHSSKESCLDEQRRNGGKGFCTIESKD